MVLLVNGQNEGVVVINMVHFGTFRLSGRKCRGVQDKYVVVINIIILSG